MKNSSCRGGCYPPVDNIHVIAYKLKIDSLSPKTERGYLLRK